MTTTVKKLKITITFTIDRKNAKPKKQATFQNERARCVRFSYVRKRHKGNFQLKRILLRELVQLSVHREKVILLCEKWESAVQKSQSR